MAQKLIRIDDITGAPDAQRIEFAYQGVEFEIDLVEENIKRLVEALAPFVEAGNKISKRGVRVPDELRAILGETVSSTTTRGSTPARRSPPSRRGWTTWGCPTHRPSSPATCRRRSARRTQGCSRRAGFPHRLVDVAR